MKGTEYLDDSGAVEEFVCIPLSKSKFGPSTMPQLETLEYIFLGSHAAAQRAVESFGNSEGMEDLIYFRERVKTFPITFDYSLILWIPSHYNTMGLGAWLLIAYYLEWFAYKRGFKKLGLKRVMKEVFASAVITQEVLLKVWEEQKVKADPDNLIDYANCVQTFMPDYTLNH